ncbi:hypothetical protein G6M89_14810 [Natronolimnobius sp. AArcel1]|uniref:HalOD1 output domain-containing protein n=1 Tax=Natronolimnobius sp. AArcel1 TaxID=1679093 RepID=UPI0013EE0287|nr:HalOD1 output domain-containing protein [Natronolimnobius sp. AArcel1]NGM70265.1 hypothetical protein [Natronolimnobius sp. AArcel1]
MIDDEKSSIEGDWCECGFQDSGECLAQKRYSIKNDDSLTTAICDAIAEAKDTSISEIVEPPLYDSIDVEALQLLLFGDSRDQYSVGTAEVVVFTHTDNQVVVNSNGLICIHE